MAAVRALSAKGYRPHVVVSGRRSSAALSRDCAGVVVLPPSESPDFGVALAQELHRHPALAVFPASDAALVALGRPGAHLVDKSRLPKFAAAAGLQMPATRTFSSVSELLADADDLGYPAVVKASIKTSARAVARRVESAADLRSSIGQISGPVVVQPFHSEGLRAVAGVIHDGALLAVVHQSYVRIWPVDCGVACAAMTTEPDYDLEDRLPSLLGEHSGVFQVQLVGRRLIDVNPRVYGSLPLAVAAGANLPGVACAAVQGRVNGLIRGAPGVRYRWLEGDVRRVVHDVRSGGSTWRQAAKALRPRRRMAHSVESLRDPVPGLVRLVELGRRR